MRVVRFDDEEGGNKGPIDLRFAVSIQKLKPKETEFELSENEISVEYALARTGLRENVIGLTATIFSREFVSSA